MIRLLKGDLSLAHQHWWPIPISNPDYKEEIQKVRKEAEEVQDYILQSKQSDHRMEVDAKTSAVNKKEKEPEKTSAKDCADTIDEANYAMEHIGSVLAGVKNRNDGLVSEVSEYFDEKFGLDDPSPGEEAEERDALKIERLRRRFVAIEQRMSKQIVELRNLRAAEAESDFDAQIQNLYSRLQKLHEVQLHTVARNGSLTQAFEEKLWEA
ncbi:hypothetical protein CPB86DRAFT_458015 [Serendipita vermifera]|nr:hypothetical protein CPB86DRAFT_458015 [Serendipita vermifera]